MRCENKVLGHHVQVDVVLFVKDEGSQRMQRF